MNINSIHGGMPEPPKGSTALPAHCVRGNCRIVNNRRYLIEENIDSVRDEVTNLLEGLKAIRPKFNYNLKELNHVIPSMTDREAPIARTVAEAIETVMGKAAQFVASPGSYDQKHIDRIGKLKNCVAYGPGILELAHKPDEYISVDDMMDSAAVMARSLASLLLQKQ